MPWNLQCAGVIACVYLSRYIPRLPITELNFLGCGSWEFSEVCNMSQICSMREGPTEYLESSQMFLKPVSCHPHMMGYCISLLEQTIHPPGKDGKYKWLQMTCTCHDKTPGLLVALWITRKYNPHHLRTITSLHNTMLTDLIQTLMQSLL